MPNPLQQALKKKIGSGNKPGHNSGNFNNWLKPPNPDPRPPNEYKPKPGGQSNAQQTYKPPKGGGSNASIGGNNNGQGGGGSPSTQPTVNNGGFIPGGPTDPRDAQYWKDVVTLGEKRDIELQNLNLEQTHKGIAYTEALEKLARQLPKDILSTQENANRGGAFYSSKTGEAVGQIGVNYFNQRSTLARTKQEEDDLREVTRSMIQNGYSIDEAAAYAAAVDRAAQAEADRPAPPDDSTAETLEDLLEEISGGSGGGSRGGSSAKNKPKNNKPGGGKNKPGNKPNNQQGNKPHQNQGGGGGQGNNKPNHPPKKDKPKKK